MNKCSQVGWFGRAPFRVQTLVLILILTIPNLIFWRLALYEPSDDAQNSLAQNSSSPSAPPTISEEFITQKYGFLRNFTYKTESVFHSFNSSPLAYSCANQTGTNVTKSIPPLRVVYQIAWVPNRFWATQFVVEHQLTELALIGLADTAELHLVVQTPNPRNILWLKGLVSRLKLPPVRYYFLERNMWEFSAMHVVWELACREDNPDALYLYMHSKGVTRMNPGTRWREELVTFYEVVYPWRQIVHLFDSNSNIETVGFVADGSGFFWFNMWWARGSYLMRMSEPGISMTDRYYYEYYLSQHLTADMIYNVTRGGKIQRVGSHCLAAREIFRDIDSPMLLQSTYNYNESTPMDQLRFGRSAKGAYSLRSCSLNAGVDGNTALMTIYARCFLIKDPKPRCGFIDEKDITPAMRMPPAIPAVPAGLRPVSPPSPKEKDTSPSMKMPPVISSVPSLIPHAPASSPIQNAATPVLSMPPLTPPVASSPPSTSPPLPGEPDSKPTIAIPSISTTPSILAPESAPLLGSDYSPAVPTPSATPSMIPSPLLTTAPSKS
jgi:hypothetical protein